MSGEHGEIICCANCGRDTKSKTGVCRTCSGYSAKRGPSEHLGRTARYMHAVGGSVANDVDDDDPDLETSLNHYHGESERDDL